MYAIPKMAVFCSSALECLPGVSSEYLWNNGDRHQAGPITIGIIIILLLLLLLLLLHGARYNTVCTIREPVNIKAQATAMPHTAEASVSASDDRRG
jgi:hypothetical protein